MSYEAGDIIMNAAFCVGCSPELWTLHDNTLPPIMSEVYQAINQGEWIRECDDLPPDFRCTKPHLEAFLKTLDSGKR